MEILIDTSALLSIHWTQDANHQKAARQLHKLQDAVIWVAMPVLSEFFYIANSRMKDYRRVLRALIQIRTDYGLVSLEDEDTQRMEQIKHKYADAEFDYADAALMALSERLGITRVFTFDHRDFGMFIPAHSPHLELIP
jgi:hypothetical protein